MHDASTLEWRNFLRSLQSARSADVEIAPSQRKYTQDENKSIYHERNENFG